MQVNCLHLRVLLVEGILGRAVAWDGGDAVVLLAAFVNNVAVLGPRKTKALRYAKSVLAPKEKGQVKKELVVQ